MKKVIIPIIFIIVVLSSCTTTSNIPRSTAYSGMYKEKPLSILIMPPINRSTNVEAKEYFHSTLNTPLANAGYYVVPPFLSMEILKRESAYDAELFLNSPLSKFQEVFGADLAIFTIIHKWDKSGIAAKVFVEVEYIIKSTKTNEILYSRHGNVIYDASIQSSGGGLAGALVAVAVSAINTAATKYVDVARAANAFTFKDLPVGKYSQQYNQDGHLMSGHKNFDVMLNKNYR